VITVSAALASFDPVLLRAAASLGSGPIRSFFKIMLPLISTGVASGALFAFVTSFDEVVVALFIAGVEQRTVPLQMWSGLRDSITPALLAAATLLFLISASLLIVVEALKRRSASLRAT
jgi:putative spermidine/putrescine transport system permease protein